jgi:hypothetical protein
MKRQIGGHPQQSWAPTIKSFIDNRHRQSKQIPDSRQNNYQHTSTTNDRRHLQSRLTLGSRHSASSDRQQQKTDNGNRLYVCKKKSFI